MGFFKKQLLDIIQWLDNSHDTLVYMYPMEDQEIQYGAQLIVRPGQMAVFVDKGQIADIFGPGTYKLETDNLPFLGDLKGWAYGFKSPFKSDIFFVSTKEMMNNKWGTPGPIWIPDPQFGQVQVRAFGTYTFSICDPKQFIEMVSSTNNKYTKESINAQLKDYIINHFSDAIGSLNVTVAQIASQYNEISKQMIQDVGEAFKMFGLQLNTFTVNNISLPEELQKSLQELTDMNIRGSVDTDRLARIQSIRQMDIMEKSTENKGLNGMMQSGMGLTMGMQMGQAFNQNMQNMNTLNQQASSGATAPTSQQQPTQPQNIDGGRRCTNCGQILGEQAKFCTECGTKVEVATPKKRFCPECGTLAEDGAKFCNECGTKL
ncbi:SPFH domain-containing protein [Niameybacter massiliensis]|uniref:SPFH domain-containing protein n=1 Tax=Holtiella tumoricola TaxID=3018743 RepID=A0AA42J389_9FIRM|nr:MULTISPECIES: SPFH domain-containing protein [Lachnospirales]MDA3733863.1 SPFH domain-containing protein [Holtiella tumoricola]